MNWEKSLWDASKVYGPDFPRRGSDDGTIQARRDNRAEFVAGLKAASEGGMPGYYSVYSFPWGHPMHENIPRVDCIFIDLDVADGKYDPNRGNTDFEDWRRAISALLARARMIASALIESDAAQHFRAVLSGHKGIHLYLDFPPISPEEGEFQQFKNGLRSYGEEVVDWIDSMAGGVNILPWVDVDASDLARLARHPNTRHHGAAYDDVDRWCVAVTIEELSEITVDDYLELTKRPRPMTPEMERNPSERAGRQVIQKIRTASVSSSRSGSISRYDPKAVKNYRENANDNIELEDLLDPLITGNKPCIRAFREREDAYEHGQQSRMMELSIMGRFIDMGVPIEVMHEFFEVIPGYSEDYTEELITDLIGRGFKEFNCENIAGGYDQDGQPVRGRAEEFCLGSECGVYSRNNDIQLHRRTAR
ncbi:hypothetical protein M193_gp061 [Halorubrum tailed phage 7]|uniref:hypothetical protein n=1 Tax=Halorubrum tailed phage 7 TaxID=2847108 RepID=UPI0003348E00|nr:hypothetical protein M193_gp061 [Halorubrum tailed phage 7]AGM10933.1 hypothetical protein HRTV7_61 [Halorubrum tailed phage 7]